MCRASRGRAAVTGLYFQESELIAKRLQFFREAIPDFKSAIVFYDARSRDHWKAAEAAGGELGLRLSGVDLHDPPYDYDRLWSESRNDD
jgi:hypothetical protein